MRIGMVGLGRMGANMTLRLLRHGHAVVAYDRDPEAVDGVASEGAEGAASLDALVTQLGEGPRAVWLMLPAGAPTEDTIAHLETLLGSDDVIIDGSNSPYGVAQADATRLEASGIEFIDAGVSGGVWGLETGYCLMVGGPEGAVSRLAPVFTALAPENGFAHVGPAGAGHYVKMVHNGIEYGMLQAYAEGFALLDAASELDLDLHQIAQVWRHGSVVRSWLLDLAELALAKPDEFAQVQGYVEDSGEGRWTVEEAVRRAVAAPVLTVSLYERFSSRQPNSFAARIVAALRNQFGGHGFLSESAAAQHAAGSKASGAATSSGDPATGA